MAGKPLTNEAIAMTEKKMDMALDDIIKMSKPNNKQRVPNRSQNFVNNATVDNLKLRRFMDSKSSLRQGALAHRRSNFQGNQFPLAVEAARKTANAPIWNRTFNRNRTMNMNKPRIAVQRRSANGGFVSKQLQSQQKQQQQQTQAKVVSKQRPQTLDSLFANMKEQRMKVLHQQNGSNGRPNGSAARQYGRPNGPAAQQNGYGRNPNGPGQQNGFGRYNSPVGQQNGNGRRNGPWQQRPRPPWGRYND